MLKYKKISWLVRSMQYIIVSWCIWDLLKYVSWNIWLAALEKTKVKLDLLTDINMLFMVERGLRGGMYHSIYWYAKANNKCMKDYDKIKESSHLKYWDLNDSYGWQCCKSFQ